MTTISITCTGCGRQFAVPDRYQGRELKCPSCGRPFKVELPPAKPEPAVHRPVTAAAGSPPSHVPPLEASPFEEPPSPERGREAAEAPETELVGTAAVFWQVKRIGVASFAAASGTIHAAAGLLVGLVAAVTLFTPAADDVPFAHGPLLAVLVVVLLPLALGVLGLALGAVSALAYNQAARLFGGIKLLLE